LRARYDGHVADDPNERPQSVSYLWPDPETGPLRLRVWFGSVNGRRSVVGVELWGMDLPPLPGSLGTPEAPIRAEDVRIPLGRLLDAQVESELAMARASRALWSDVPGHEETVRRFEEHRGAERVGRPRLADDFLEQVTALYNQAVADGERKPAMRVLDELGPLTGTTVPETARGWIRQARKRGFPVAAPTVRRQP
jgi:hypothetical protein